MTSVQVLDAMVGDAQSDDPAQDRFLILNVKSAKIRCGLDRLAQELVALIFLVPHKDL